MSTETLTDFETAFAAHTAAMLDIVCERLTVARKESNVRIDAVADASRVLDEARLASDAAVAEMAYWADLKDKLAGFAAAAHPSAVTA